MSKHTPGPWAVREYPGGRGDKRRIFAAYTDGLTQVVATVPNANRPAQVVDANARLISAAPDMLEALQDARERLREISRMAHDAAHQPIYNRAYYGWLDDIIAKATGTDR